MNHKKGKEKKTSSLIAFKVLGIFAIFVLLLVGAFNLDDYLLMRALEKHGKLVEGKVVLTAFEGTIDPNNSLYEFVVDEKKYTKAFNARVSDRGIAIASNGLPLYEGDQFWVKYSTKNPEKNKMLFEWPTDRQISIYKKRVTQKLLEQSPDSLLKESWSDYIACRVHFHFDEFGLDGLADLYYSDRSFFVNWSNNSLSHWWLSREHAYRKAEKKCLGLLKD